MKSGSTLVEVMISIVVLAVIAIAGAAYLAQANTTVVVQRNRMSALATANGYLEELHGVLYSSLLVSSMTTTSYYYVVRNSPGNWTAPSTTMSGAIVTNNGVPMTVTNRLQRFNLSLDCIEATVSVDYRPGSGSAPVVLQTRVAQP